MLIPFDTKDGSLVSYTGTQPGSYEDERFNRGRWVWRQNFVFEDELVFLGFYRGCSSAGSTFKSLRDGKQYNVFLKDLGAIILSDSLRSGVISGTFTFVKRGANYGLRLVEVDAHE